ncbi:hypothetical protein BC829DRAFT_445964 [Chytridium lagenaria]|nr:hypothetical protein BC829DRAFT_445964 [Chytridium lagenaria]
MSRDEAGNGMQAADVPLHNHHHQTLQSLQHHQVHSQMPIPGIASPLQIPGMSSSLPSMNFFSPPFLFFETDGSTSSSVDLALAMQSSAPLSISMPLNLQRGGMRDCSNVLTSSLTDENVFAWPSAALLPSRSEGMPNLNMDDDGTLLMLQHRHLDEFGSSTSFDGFLGDRKKKALQKSGAGRGKSSGEKGDASTAPEKQCANCGCTNTPSTKMNGQQRPFVVKSDGNRKAPSKAHGN